MPAVAVREAVRRLNARHPWSHNDALHGWIRRRLPATHRDAALDVGCGRGLLASRLARRFGRVVAIDRDPVMVAAARARTAGLPVSVGQASIDDVEGRAVFDVITMVAVLHHLQPEPALADVRRLLRPGGRLLVVGLARSEGVADALWDLLCAATNPMIGFLLHPRAVRGSSSQVPDFPVADPTLTLRELRALCARALPGARLRRQLGFRYTLEWTKPGD